MIETIEHRGLRRLFEKGDASKVDPRLLDEVRRALTLLQQAGSPEDMSLPGYALHPLTGVLKGYWSVRVSGNWRVIFRIEDGHAHDVDLIAYH